MQFEAVIGLEIHAELRTKSKMFCSCAVVDPTEAQPNTAVCPVCAGMPGTLPVLNQHAVEFALRVALALGCEIQDVSVFARKNYFYPDLPKGYQISQYEHPIARHGNLTISTSNGTKTIRIRRVHLEEDTGKLTHIPGDTSTDNQPYTLVDLNRAGIPLLEIVTEPDLRCAEDVRIFATSLRSILRYLGVNSGDMQKGVLRIEPNVSVRPLQEQELGTRTEIKNLNSFRALERSVDYEIQRQIQIISERKEVSQETRGWDEKREQTYLQRRKEKEDDYRYFPEPDLPPLVIGPEWLKKIEGNLPELPATRTQRFKEQYQLSTYDAEVLTNEKSVADYFEKTVEVSQDIPPKTIANWISGDLFALINKSDMTIDQILITPPALAALIQLVEKDEINQKTAKRVLSEMFNSGEAASKIVDRRNLRQISDQDTIASIVANVLESNPKQVMKYTEGKDSLTQWFYGQVMRASHGKANPQVVKRELTKQLDEVKSRGASP
jgi:aspartyl-tRNA(Asn)/glutamyl-tRNA(Gln) amidotransferase subunit B